MHDPARRAAVNKWFDAEVIQRLNDKATGAVIVVMRRLHHDDLCGHVLRGSQAWVHRTLPAIATADETWALQSGEVHHRRKGEPLAPALDDKAELLRRMLAIGAYAFGAQYQQAPYLHTNAKEVRGGHFGGEDEHGFPTSWFGTVPERAIMAHEVFGIGDTHPAPPARKITPEEWERYACWTEDYQRRLNKDPRAAWGPPANEAALLAARRAPLIEEQDCIE